jgi:hypothetical protein
MKARIYKPAKTAMQSGTAKTKEWVLDYEPQEPREVEPLMGWTSSADMRQQVRLCVQAPGCLDPLIRRVMLNTAHRCRRNWPHGAGLRTSA